MLYYHFISTFSQPFECTSDFYALSYISLPFLNSLYSVGEDWTLQKLQRIRLNNSIIDHFLNVAFDFLKASHNYITTFTLYMRSEMKTRTVDLIAIKCRNLTTQVDAILQALYLVSDSTFL